MAESDAGLFGDLFAVPLRNGLTRPKAVRGNGVKMVNMGEIFAHDRIRCIPMDRVQIDARERELFLLERGDLLFARQSLVLSGAGKCSIVQDVDQPTTFESHIIRARLSKAAAEPLFFYYFFKSRSGRSAIESIVEQVTAAGIRGSDLAGLEVPTPPLWKQRAIAEILGTLDDKIELNRRKSEALEAAARALFKSWFVDFDVVRARVEGRGRVPTDETAALFPESFDDSEIDELPRGWGRDTLAGFAALNPEAWSTATRPPTIRYVDLSNTKWGRIEAAARYQQADAPSRAQRVLRPGDTLVGTVRPGNGSYALVADEGLTGSTGFAVLRPRRPEFREFVYLAATAADNIETLAHLADGGAYPAVRAEVVGATPVVRVPDLVLARFSRLTAPLLAAIAESERASRTLAELRDTLLPKLISGELRVKDAERVVETVA